MVDVMIAVDMLRHTHKGNMARCTLLTSDLDFKPLVDALVQEGMHVTLWHGNKASRDLRRAADSLRPLNSIALAQILADDTLRRLDLPQAQVGLPTFDGCFLQAAGQSENGFQWRHLLSSTGDQILAWEAGPPYQKDSWFQITGRSLESVRLYAEDAYGMTFEF